MPLQATSGTASYDAFGGGVAAVPNYIEDVFSTYLYTGNGPSSQTITNGIDLAGKGGLVWFKRRDSGSPFTHELVDTVQGAGKFLSTPSAAGWGGVASDITSFNANGFSINDNTGLANNGSMASWTFRKQPKFFDVVTYTGNGTAGRQIAHSLGSTPGFLVVKRTDSTSNWSTWHTSIPNAYMSLDTTNPQNTDNGVLWGNGSTHIDPTSTVFTVSSNAQVNASGGTYVAYLFAHNAGGFGLTGNENVVSCGSFTGGIGSVNLGYEPQWIMIKRTNTTGEWIMFDTMRGWPTEAPNKLLMAQSSAAEGDTFITFQPTATGFNYNLTGDYIYIAIRRGPMKVPTSGTSVFSPALYTGTGSTNTITSPFPSDLLLVPNRAGQFYSPSFWDRLRGATKFLRSPGTDAEAVSSDGLTSFGAGQNSVAVGADATYGNINFSGRNYVPYSFRRAPSFFDEVCWTAAGLNVVTTVTHNLKAVPELIIVKNRSSAVPWPTRQTTLMPATDFMTLNSTNASSFASSNAWGTSAPTSSVFYINENTLSGAGNIVAYLFATCAGVSKVGSYTGNGSSQTINCGFTGGARFVLIKRTSAAGDWYVWDTARGIVSANDPHLSLNTTAAEVTTDDTIDTDSTGFIVNQVTATNVNVSSATYIYLAIA